MNNYRHLFSALHVGSITLKNRLVMAPMLMGYANSGGEVTDTVLDYYETRARGGLGMIVVEASCVSLPEGKEGYGQIHIDNEGCIPGLSRLAAAIKKYDCKAFIQLFHAGRQTSSKVTGSQPVAPSSRACKTIREIPHELSGAEIRQLTARFIQAAQYAYEAGFDGVELHAAHGYLLNEFLSPNINTRKDEYGGSLENRMRILLDIITGIKARANELVVSVRLNIDDFTPGGLHPEESVIIAREMEAHGVDIIHCTCGTYESGLTSIEPASYPEGWRVYLAEEVKRYVSIPVVTGGMINSPAFADQVIAEGRADLVFLGRSLLADPEWPNKASQGKTDEIRPCIRCNGCINTHFAGMPVSCTVNPRTGRENQYRIKALQSSFKPGVHIIGAGPAGIHAALILDAMDYKVSLFEQATEPGGLLPLAAVPPHKDRLRDYYNYLLRRLAASRVEQVYGHHYRIADIESHKPDHVIIATGSRPQIPTLPGIEQCLQLEDVLSGKINISDADVIIIGAGSNGCELADYLLQYRNRITLLEERPTVAADMDRKNRRDLLNRLDEGEADRLTGHKVLRVTPFGAVVCDSSQNIKEIPGQHVILATGYQPVNHLYHEACRLMSSVYVAGDALRVRGLKSAIMEAQMVAHMICRSDQDKAGGGRLEPR